MIIRSGLLALLLLLVPGTVMAQLAEPSAIPVHVHTRADPFRVEWRDSVPEPVRPRIEQARGAGPVQHLAVGALAGAALGYGAYLIQENTTPHTSHEMDPLARFAFVSTGTLAGAVAGAFVYYLRTR